MKKKAPPLPPSVFLSSEGNVRDVWDAEDIATAIHNKKVYLAFQPVVHTKHLGVAFYETLSRLQLEDGTYLSPGNFMLTAERMNLARPIDEMNLTHAVKILKQNEDIHLSVNVSAQNVKDGSFLTHAVSELREEEGAAARLIIEVTETAEMHHVAEVSKFIQKMQEMGTRVALDDFGSGHTSFAQLEKLDVDIVKIDGSYMQDLSVGSDSLTFIQTVLDLSQTHHFQVVAEHVETEDDLKILAGMGVDYVQGYLVGKPVMDEAENLEEIFTPTWQGLKVL